MPPTPVSNKHTGLGNQKKPKDWESPPPLPAPGTPEFESWAATPQKDTSGGNSRMVGHQEKPRNASEPDTNPHRISLDEHGDSVKSELERIHSGVEKSLASDSNAHAAEHAAMSDIANDTQFSGHDLAPAKTKLGGGEIDPAGIARFQADLIADRQKRGVPEQGDYQQRKSAWEAAGGSSGTGTAEEANAMLKSHRSAVAAKPGRSSDAKTPKAAEKAAPRPAPSPASQPPKPSPDKEAVPESGSDVNSGKIEAKPAPARQEPQPSSTPDVSSPSPSAKMARIGGNFAPRSTPTSMSIPSNAAGTKFNVLKAKGAEAAPATASSPAPAEKPASAKAPADNKTRFMPTPDKAAAPVASPVPVSPPLASSRPAPLSTGTAPRTVHPAPSRAAHSGKPVSSLAESKSIGGGNKAATPTTSPTSAPPSAPSVPTTRSSPAPSARSSRSSGGGNGWGEVHHHIHNYYGATQVGDHYVNHGGVQNIGGTMSIGQSGGSTGGGPGHGGGGSRNPRNGSGQGRGHASRPATPAYGKPTLGQAIIHTALNSTVNGKSVNDHVHAATGQHVEQHDTQGRRIGDPHSDIHKMKNVHRVEGHHGAANAYHEHEQLRSQRLGQQFTP